VFSDLGLKIGNYSLVIWVSKPLRRAVSEPSISKSQFSSYKVLGTF
jgi:hypothetical protein